MPLKDLLADVSVKIISAVDRNEVLHIASQELACQQAGCDALYESLIQRETLGSTAIGHGIAIPHGRLPELTAPRGTLLKLQPAISFFASDGEPVSIVFAMAIPAHYTHQHLMLLSELAECFSDTPLREKLQRARSITTLKNVLDLFPSRISA